MSRSRSLNRLYRLNAKRKRRSLRSAVPGLDLNSFEIEKIFSLKKRPRSQDIKENEFEYIRLVIIFLDDQTLRVKNLLKDSIQLLKEKKYISSMFILRGFVESCLFDIFITLSNISNVLI